MKKKTRLYIYAAAAGAAAGTLVWELLQVILQSAGFAIDLSAGPVGFDISVIALYLRINPGTVIGSAAAFFILGRK